LNKNFNSHDNSSIKGRYFCAVEKSVQSDAVPQPVQLNISYLRKNVEEARRSAAAELGVLAVDSVELAQLEPGHVPAHRTNVLLILVAGRALRDGGGRTLGVIDVGALST
jgi:hypothetical protein